jgi:hypothetical protein
MDLDEIELEIMNIQLNTHYAERARLEKKLDFYITIKNQIYNTYEVLEGEELELYNNLQKLCLNLDHSLRSVLICIKNCTNELHK